MQANWIVLVVALVIGLLVAWLVFARSRRTRVESTPTDEAQATPGPRRNQALIDAPPAAASPTPGPTGSQPPAHTSMAATPIAERAQSAAEATRVMPPAAPVGLAGASEAAVTAAAMVRSQTQSQTQREAEPDDGAIAGAEPEPIEPAAAPTPLSTGDDLTHIKGLGPRLALQLQGLGITSFGQIAAWDEREIDRIDAQLGRFQGRIRRDQWPEQARLLAAGDAAGYEDRFGKL